MAKITSDKKRPGRPPLGEFAMTPAEQKKRSRQRLRDQGSKEFMVRLSGGALELADCIATAGGVSRSQVLEQVFWIALMRMGDLVLAEIKASLDAGGSLQQALQDAATSKPRSD